MKNKLKKILLLISAVLFFAISMAVGGVKAEAATGQDVVNYAKQFLGCKYVYGAAGPNTFDCSGLTSYCYRNAAGIDIGRTTKNQINAGREVSRNELQPGDLVFPHSGHVGIYVGNGQMIHAPQTGDVVKISNITKFWRARRIIETPAIDFSSPKVRAVFDAGFYFERYPDLKKAFGTDANALYNHFITNGINEGRCASETFDVKYYLKHNKDLQKAFGSKNYRAAYNHFLANGISEKRDLSPVFNMKYYIAHNSDVSKAYGKDYYGIIDHFIRFGMKEGRASSENFNLNAYKSRYKDLRKAYGNNNVLYYRHYLNHGIAEGRNAKK